jgi:hypothetical protein
MFYKESLEKDQELCHLKDHIQKLLAQIKNSKDTKQCIQKLGKNNQDLRKKSSEKDEETSRLKSLNQILLEKIRKLKEEGSEKEEKSCLKIIIETFLRKLRSLKMIRSNWRTS